MNIAYISIGSNIGDAPGYLREALQRLAAIGTLAANSDFYITEPWGKTGQSKFYNAVAALDMGRRRDPQRLLYALTAIENDYERTRAERWGPRTIDLDLLLYGDVVAGDDQFTVPHPRMRERAFVLAPLADIAPDLPIPPDGITPRRLLSKLSAEARAGVIKLPNTGRLPAPRPVDYDANHGPGADYERLRPLTAFDRALFDAVAEAVVARPGDRVLDVGCGTGRFTRLFAERGLQVTGIDRSDLMLDRARAQAKGANPLYLRADAVDRLPGSHWNAISAFLAIHHFSSPERFLMLARQSLAAGGTLAIATFTHRHFAESPFARFFPHFTGVDMARFPSAPALSRMLRQAGFTSVEQRDVVGEVVQDYDTVERLVREKYLSTFYLLEESEIESGIAAMRAAWQSLPEIRRSIASVVISGRRP
mgnify:CR=1 FL=1